MHRAEITVAAVIAEAGRYLLVEESPAGTAVFNQPAGHLEAGESLFDAVRRETLEETGWPFEPTGLVGVYQWSIDDQRTLIRFVFCGDLDRSVARAALDPDIDATHWLTAAEIADAASLRSPLVVRAVHDYEQAAALPLDRLQILGHPADGS